MNENLDETAATADVAPQQAGPLTPLSPLRGEAESIPTASAAADPVTKAIPEVKPIPEGFWRVRFKVDNNCVIDRELQPVKAGETADVAPWIGYHFVANGIAERVLEA